MLLLLALEILARAEPAFKAMVVITTEVEYDHFTVRLVVGEAGLEPAWLAPRDFKSLVYTNFTTRPGRMLIVWPGPGFVLEARGGVEPP